MKDRSFPEAADGRPALPMEPELWAAGCDPETAHFVARQLAANGYTLVRTEEQDAIKAENAAARGVITQANNSLYGSCSFFLSANGGDADMSHLSRPIEELKDRARRAYALEAENARLRKAMSNITQIAEDAMDIACMGTPSARSMWQRPCSG